MNQPADRDEARRLADAATPGPWVIEASGGVDPTGEGWYQVEIAFNDPLEPHAGLMLGDHENNDADAEFIAAARSLVPALLDELDATVADRDQLRTELAKVQERLDGWIQTAEMRQDEVERLRAQVQADRPDMRDQRQQEISE